ncbi:hypothetical protein [Geobacillus thermoleovorans]
MKRTKITKDHGWTHALSESKSGKSKMLPRANASWLFAWSWKDIWGKDVATMLHLCRQGVFICNLKKDSKIMC